MRTKTPDQLYQQTSRIMFATLKQYGRKRGVQICQLVKDICWRYIDKIYALNGVPDRHTERDTMKANNIWYNGATEVCKYM